MPSTIYRSLKQSLTPLCRKCKLEGKGEVFFVVACTNKIYLLKRVSVYGVALVCLGLGI